MSKAVGLRLDKVWHLWTGTQSEYRENGRIFTTENSLHWSLWSL